MLAVSLLAPQLSAHAAESVKANRDAVLACVLRTGQSVGNGTYELQIDTGVRLSAHPTVGLAVNDLTVIAPVVDKNNRKIDLQFGPASFLSSQASRSGLPDLVIPNNDRSATISLDVVANSFGALSGIFRASIDQAFRDVMQAAKNFCDTARKPATI